MADTKAAVDLLQSNDLSHIETDMREVARTNAQLMALSTAICDGIIKLVDRTERN